jgi:lysine-specific demethylase 8
VTSSEISTATGTAEIKRLHRPDAAAFQRDFVQTSTPAIITGVMDDWAARKWTPDALKSRVGDVMCSVHETPSTVMEGDEATKNFKGRPVIREIPYGQYLDGLATANDHDWKHYQLGQSLRRAFPALLADVGPFDLIDRPRANDTPFIWSGPAGFLVRAHYDPAPGMLAHVYGRKHVVLFSRSSLSQMYPFQMLSQIPYVSRVDIEAPDLERFPRFREAQRYETYLEPGEILFIPCFWWHQIRYETVAISLNFWFRPSLREIVQRPGLRFLPYYLRGILQQALRPLRRAS